MAVNGFALLMGLLLVACGLWGPRLVSRLDLIRESRLVQDPRLRLSARRQVAAMRIGLGLMGLALVLSSLTLTGAPAEIYLIIAAALMLVGLLGLTIAMILTIRQTRR